MRLFSHGNSVRRSWLDLPLIRFTARWMLSWGSTDRSRCTWSGMTSIGDRPRDLLEAIVDTVHENGSAVLRAEDHVVVAGKHYVTVALVLHGIDIIHH